jgi:hypothetical protein
MAVLTATARVLDLFIFIIVILSFINFKINITTDSQILFNSVITRLYDYNVVLMSNLFDCFVIVSS